MTKDVALKMAIKALELCDGNGLKDYDFCIAIHKCKTALNACKEALEQPAQEPVAWKDEEGIWEYEWESYSENKKPLYTHPAQPCQECENLKHDLDSYMKMAHAYANQKQLSDDAIIVIYNELYESGLPDVDFARAIEKAHGIGVEND